MYFESFFGVMLHNALIKLLTVLMEPNLQNIMIQFFFSGVELKNYKETHELEAMVAYSKHHEKYKAL